MSYQEARGRLVSLLAGMSADISAYASRKDAKPNIVSNRRAVIEALAGALDGLDAAHLAELEAAARAIQMMRERTGTAYERGFGAGYAEAQRRLGLRENEYPTGAEREKVRRHSIADTRNKWPELY